MAVIFCIIFTLFSGYHSGTEHRQRFCCLFFFLLFFVNSSVCLFSFCIVTVYMYVPGMLIMNYY